MSLDEFAYVKAKRAEQKASSVQAQLDQAIQDGDQLVEVQQARVDVDGNPHVTLKDRIDSEVMESRQKDSQLDVRLTQTKRDIVSTREKINRELISKRNRKPMITIIDDDGRTDFIAKWEPILQEKPMKLDIAVITDWVGRSDTQSFMSWDDLERLKEAYDIDLVNHTHTHRYMAELTEDEVRWELENSTQILKDRGHSYDIMVYPYGSQNAMVRQVTREYCRVGVHISGGVVTPPLDTFKLSRQGLIPQTGTMESVEAYTAYIDEAIENNGWIIWMTHSQYEPFDAEKVKAVIDYANSKNIEWVHTREGLDRIGNLIDFGDYTERLQAAEYTILDADGKLHSRSNSKDYYIMPGYGDFGKPLTEYDAETYTVELVSSAQAEGFPESKAGIVETFRGRNDSYNYQTYKIYNSNSKYIRRWVPSTSTWEEFIPTNSRGFHSRFSQTIDGEVPANGILNITIDVADVTNDDNVVGTPRSGLENGLMYTVFVPAVGKVRVRLLNTTDSPITTSRPWKFDIIKQS